MRAIPSVRVLICSGTALFNLEFFKCSGCWSSAVWNRMSKLCTFIEEFDMALRYAYTTEVTDSYRLEFDQHVYINAARNAEYYLNMRT